MNLRCLSRLACSGWALCGLVFFNAASPIFAQDTATPASATASANEASANEASAVEAATPSQSAASPTQQAGESTAAAPQSPATPNAEPAPAADAPGDTAATGEVDPEAKAARLKELLSLVQDNTRFVHKRENPAYFSLMKEVIDRTPEQLRETVTLNPRFNDLYRKPSQYRGQLVHVKLNARRILPVDYQSENAAGVTRLYEIWGWTEEAKAWMYCCVVPELPPGFPEEGDIAKRIELTGYFFKMQAYQPGNAAPNARDLVAPLVIGKIVDLGQAPLQTKDSMGNWPLILIIGFGGIIMFRIMLHLGGLGKRPSLHRNYRRRSLEPIDPEALDDALAGPDRGVRIRNANEA